MLSRSVKKKSKLSVAARSSLLPIICLMPFTSVWRTELCGILRRNCRLMCQRAGSGCDLEMSQTSNQAKEYLQPNLCQMEYLFFEELRLERWQQAITRNPNTIFRKSIIKSWSIIQENQAPEICYYRQFALMEESGSLIQIPLSISRMVVFFGCSSILRNNQAVISKQR